MANIVQKASLKRQQINAAASKRAGEAAVNIGVGVLDLAVNAGLAIVTKNPYAIAGTAVAAGLLAKQLFF